MPYCKKCGNELLPKAKFCPNCRTPIESTQPIPKEASFAPPNILLAHWGERLIAWLIDIVIEERRR